MVSTLKRRMGMGVAGFVLLVLAACQSSQPQNESRPGALPASRSGLTPALNAATYAAHGELLERRGDYERAADQYRKALELDAELVTVRNRLGVTLNKLGRHGEASAEFRRTLLRQPNEAYLHNNLGFSLYLEGNYEAAEPRISRALELNPEFRRARMNHGLVLAKLGRYDEALAEFKQAGTEADAHYNIAVVQAEAGQYAAAARSLEQALRCDPNLTAAREHLRQIARLATEEEAARLAAAEAAAAQQAAAAQEQARLAAAEQAAREAAEQQARAAEAVRPAETAPDVAQIPDTGTDRVATTDEAARRAAVNAAQAQRAAETQAARVAAAEQVVQQMIADELARLIADERTTRIAAQPPTATQTDTTTDPRERSVVNVVDVRTERFRPAPRPADLPPIPFTPYAPLTPTVLDPDTSARMARVFDRIQLAIAEHGDTVTLNGIRPVRLTAIFDDLLSNMTAGEPYFEHCLTRIEELLDRLPRQTQ